MTKIHRILLGTLPLAFAALIPASKAGAQTPVPVSPLTGFSVAGEGVFLSSNSTTFNGGPSVKFKSIAGLGVEGSYAINDQFTLNADLWSASADLSGGGSTLNLTATTSTVGADWNAPKAGPVTPYVGIDLGDIHYSSHYSSHDVSETDFIYGAHVGVRYDIDQHWFGKLALQIDETQLEDSTGTLTMTGGVVAIGYRF